MLLQLEKVPEMQFPAIWIPKNQIFPPWGPPLRYYTKQTLKKQDFFVWGGGGGQVRGAVVDKNAWIKG